MEIEKNYVVELLGDKCNCGGTECLEIAENVCWCKNCGRFTLLRILITCKVGIYVEVNEINNWLHFMR